ncbi:MAG: aminotransferase class IV [Planctomycetota bacterium]
MLVSLNGVKTPPDEARISVFDRGFLFGDAIYEVVATHGGRLYRLRAHLDRLEESGRAVGLDVAALRGDLEREIKELVAEGRREGDEVYVRIMITRGETQDFDLAGDGGEPLRVVMVKRLAPWPARFYAEGVKLMTVSPDEIVARIAPSVKSNNRQANVMAHRFARREGADDALFVDPEGNVTEGPSWNMFGARAGRLWTPPLAGGILPGITRSSVLSICREAGIPLDEREVSKDEALASDEWFITSTTRGVMPVGELDGRRPPHGSPGPLTQRVQEAWEQLADAGEA